jgi:hypothetical protein
MELQEPNIPCLEQCATHHACISVGIVCIHPLTMPCPFFPSPAPSRLVLIHIHTHTHAHARSSPCYSCCAVPYRVASCCVADSLPIYATYALPLLLRIRDIGKTRHPILLPSIHTQRVSRLSSISLVRWAEFELRLMTSGDRFSFNRQRPRARLKREILV